VSAQLENTTILVVEDEADDRELLRSVLEQSGATVVTAESVDAALEIHRQYPPHAVITDIRLGCSDGYAFIKAIRENN
jgi:CheY-like chemotaxis protein